MSFIQVCLLELIIPDAPETTDTPSEDTEYAFPAAAAAVAAASDASEVSSDSESEKVASDQTQSEPEDAIATSSSSADSALSLEESTLVASACAAQPDVNSYPEKKLALERIVEILTDFLMEPEIDVVDPSNDIFSLATDSLALVHLQNAMRDEYGVELTFADMMRLATADNIATFVCQRIHQA